MTEKEKIKMLLKRLRALAWTTSAAARSLRTD